MHDYLRSYLRDCVVCVIIVFCVCAVLVVDGNKKSREDYETACKLEQTGEYTVYLNGDEKDSSHFSIESLGRRGYTFKIDEKKKRININSVSSSRHVGGTVFVPGPIIH